MEAHPEFILPAGDYLIIDPCYVYDGARWQTLVDALFQGVDLQHIVTDPITGCRFAYSSTATGDGVYADDERHLHGVDTGGIACLPLAMIDATVLVSLPERDRSRDKACSGRL